MKKAFLYSIIGALSLAFVGNITSASEISGTISTGGGAGTPVPTQTPNPSGNSGHSSEISGNLETNVSSSASEIGGTVTGGSNGSSQNNNDYIIPANAYGNTALSVNYGSSAPTPESEPEATTTDPSPSSGGVSDEELARFALLSFGPRFGTPGPPDAGGSDQSVLSVGSDSLSSSDEDTEDVSLAFVPRPGEGFGIQSDDQVAASLLTGASGLTLAQLLLIALIGLILLASMGYAIGRSGGGGPRPAM